MGGRFVISCRLCYSNVLVCLLLSLIAFVKCKPSSDNVDTCYQCHIDTKTPARAFIKTPQGDACEMCRIRLSQSSSHAQLSMDFTGDGDMRALLTIGAGCLSTVCPSVTRYEAQSQSALSPGTISQ